MKTYTKEEIYAMSDDEAKKAISELLKIYFDMFGKDFEGVPSLQTVQEAADEIAHYIRIEKPAPTPTYEELYEYDY